MGLLSQGSDEAITEAKKHIGRWYVKNGKEPREQDAKASPSFQREEASMILKQWHIPLARYAKQATLACRNNSCVINKAVVGEIRQNWYCITWPFKRWWKKQTSERDCPTAVTTNSNIEKKQWNNWNNLIRRNIVILKSLSRKSVNYLLS